MKKRRFRFKVVLSIQYTDVGSALHNMREEETRSVLAHTPKKAEKEAVSESEREYTKNAGAYTRRYSVVNVEKTKRNC